MNASELKTKIFHEVDVLDTTELEEFYGVMLNFLNSKKETQEWIGVTEQRKTGILEAIDELNSGKGIPHAQVMNKFRDKYTNV